MDRQEEILAKARDKSVEKFQKLRIEKESLFNKHKSLLELIWDLGAGVVPRYLLSDILLCKEIVYFNTENEYANFISKLERYKLIRLKKFEGTTRKIIILTSFTLGNLTNKKTTKIEYTKQKVVLSAFKFCHIYTEYIYNKSFKSDNKIDEILKILKNDSSLLCNANQGYKFSKTLMNDVNTKYYVSNFSKENYDLMYKRMIVRRKAFMDIQYGFNIEFPKSQEQSIDTLINRNIYISIDRKRTNNNNIFLNVAIFDVHNNLYTSKIAKYILETYHLLKRYFKDSVVLNLNIKVIACSKEDSKRLKEDCFRKQAKDNKILIRIKEHHKKAYQKEVFIPNLILEDININIKSFKIQERLFEHIHIQNLKESRKIKYTKTKELEDKVKQMEDNHKQLLKAQEMLLIKLEELEKSRS